MPRYHYLANWPIKRTVEGGSCGGLVGIGIRLAEYPVEYGRECIGYLRLFSCAGGQGALFGLVQLLNVVTDIL